MKGDHSIETPPSYVESVGPSRSAGHGAQPGQATVSPGFQQQQSNDTSTPLSPGRASTSSDSSSQHGSRSLWGRRKGKEREKVQEKEDTSAELKEFERRRRQQGSSVEAATSAYLSHIPPTAQKALAPLTVSTDLKDIVGSYSIELSTSIAYAQAANGTTPVTPTCKFTSSTRNDIDVTLYFRPPPSSAATNGGCPALPPRTQNDVPLEILANNKKGKIKMTIPHRLPGRPLRIICSLEGESFGVLVTGKSLKCFYFVSANAYLYLPPEFDGKLAIWAPQGTIELSEPLRRNSTIIPSTSNNAYITVYKITPSQTPQSDSASQSSPNLMDLAQVNTTKGRVRVEYARDNGDSCVVM